MVRIIARLNVGGATRQVCTLHEKLASDFETRLIVGGLSPGEEDMSYLLVSERNVFRVPQMAREISVLSDAVAFWRILRLLRRERPQIVHTHTAKAGAVGRLAAWLAGVPVIVHTYHGHVFHGYFGPLRTRMFLAIERMLGRMSTRVIAISESQLQELASRYRVVPRNKIAVVQDGFDFADRPHPPREEARQRFGLGTEDLVVGWAGRMVPVKDVALLGSVIQRAAQAQKRICFLVAGDGTERSKLESLIQGCANVRLVGWQQDMAQFWAAADVALLTSRNEGTPTSLIEAMASGLPFVATHVGGVQDLGVAPLRELPDGSGWEAANGFLTVRTPEALLACIERIARDPEAGRQKAAVGRALVLRRFSVSRLVRDTASLYHALLQERRAAAFAAVPAPDEHAPQTGDTD